MNESFRRGINHFIRDLIKAIHSTISFYTAVPIHLCTFQITHTHTHTQIKHWLK